MIYSLSIGIGAVVGMFVFWMVVQYFWKQTFAEHVDDVDAMAGRTKCSNCSCVTICENKKEFELEKQES